MNIFFSDLNPYLCAQNLDDKRVIKMCLESTQMLCTALNHHGHNTPYKSTHANHPSNVWARQTKTNFLWLLDHAFYLCDEYERRYAKTHKCLDILNDLNTKSLSCFSETPATPFANCAANSSKGVDFKHIGDTVEAYRQYLTSRWNTDVRPPTWYKLTGVEALSVGVAPKWLIVDKDNKLVYKDKNYEVLFGGPNETPNINYGILGDINSLPSE
jgi:hypothetical protein